MSSEVEIAGIAAVIQPDHLEALLQRITERNGRRARAFDVLAWNGPTPESTSNQEGGLNAQGRVARDEIRALGFKIRN